MLKRFDPSKLFSLACQDMVERFHLVVSLLFVVVEEMDSSGRWQPLPGLLWQCGQIFGAEMVIDVVKHAVLGKFNQIRPGVYQEFMKVRCPSFYTFSSCLPGRPEHLRSEGHLQKSGFGTLGWE